MTTSAFLLALFILLVFIVFFYLINTYVKDRIIKIIFNVILGIGALVWIFKLTGILN